MVSRIYVEKKSGFDVEAAQLSQELRSLLGIESLKSLRILNRYDVEGITDELFERCIPTVFSEPQSDTAYRELPEIQNEAQSSEQDGPRQDSPYQDSPQQGTPQSSTHNSPHQNSTPQNNTIFAVEYLPGQFDQRADSASECIQLISQGERPEVRSAKVYILTGELSATDIEAIKHYVINPVEAREASLDPVDTLELEQPDPQAVEILDGFTNMNEAALADFINERGLAMDLADAIFCRDYFAKEGRHPTITEIKMIDTYWSDHCRHTTFSTELDEIKIDDSVVQMAFNRYLQIREELGRQNRPICLMDMGTIGAKYLAHTGQLQGLDESEEVNACTVKITCDVNGEDQDWLFLFKNETHNHPTEIEPFGGAATCVGGAIRDPLSGRSYVYQAMRVTGAGDPLVPVSETLEGKLPQRKLVTTAAAGYSSYGNQIGLATGQVSEIYHPGYIAKRMEIGAVLGATPADHVRREKPQDGDVVVLLGGRTGRDGIGGATGSSKAHSQSSIESCGAEVQKGNAPVERKIQRLFRRKEACRLIKRCNDFGAGGVSVAIGELADGLLIDLDKVPRKYDGLDGTELAISESQERMAVALAADDVDEFIRYAHEENLEANPVAKVTGDERVRMTWRGDTIVDVSRDFLASNGAPKHMNAHIQKGSSYSSRYEGTKGTNLKERLESVLTDLNCCSSKGLGERFDSTIGAASVLMPFGGKYQLTPPCAMVAKLPVEGQTTTTSGLAWGFNPYIMECDQYRGAYLSVVESVSKMIAAGFERSKMYLSFQEYFEKLRDEATRWGKPAGALLGALMAQIDLGIGAVGGKDSMSGSFEDLDVPPTLVSFAAGTGTISRATSPEFKGADHKLLCIHPYYEPDGLLPEVNGLNQVFAYIEDLIEQGIALSVSTPGRGYAALALFEMCVGNRIGIKLAPGFDDSVLFIPAYGTFLVEAADDVKLPAPSSDVTVEEIGITIADYAIISSSTEGIGSAPDSDSAGSTADTTNAGSAEASSVTEKTSTRIDLAKLQEAWESVLEPVFPYRSKEDPKDLEVETISSTQHIPLTYHGHIARPRVVIPVFPGTNCEYDTAAAFERAGAVASTYVINNLSPDKISQSVHEVAQLIKTSQILMIPGGFSGGDEPDGSAKLITAFFRAPEITEAVRELLQDRDGLMLGICNGFQALIKLGLVPYGDIVEMNDECPTLSFNTIGRHQSCIVRTRVASNLSPWLSRSKVGDIHTMPISHGEGRFVAPKALLDELVSKGQVATQYVDINGKASMDLAANPNGSMLAIEGITSPDGRVFGKMGHTERSGDGLYLNIPEISYQPIFESGVDYFC